MSMRALMAAAPFACLLLAGCGTTAPSPFRWTTGQGEASGSLRFGEPGTDNIGYRLDCRNGQLEFAAWSPSPPKGVDGRTFPASLRLATGGRVFDLSATGSVTGMGDGETIVTARPDDPVAFLAAMRGARRLVTRTYDGEGSAPAPSPTQLTRFAAECGIEL